MPQFPDAPQAKKAPQERSRFCKNRSKGFGDKFPQQAQSGSKPPCLPSVKPTGFAGWQAAKRALFALLASPFSVLQRHTIFNRGFARHILKAGSTPQKPILWEILLKMWHKRKTLIVYLYLYKNLSSRYPSNRQSADNAKITSRVFQSENSAGKFGAIIENDAKSADPEI